jgi:Rrf2 family transcriptional regulator, iron-sulfur cluster assembly transcription factor
MNALSHTTGYAVVALSFVGSSDRAWVQAKDIASSTGIPKPYLSKILHALGKAGLIRTKRGIGGGVSLSRSADDVTLLQVAQAVEAIDSKQRCFLGMATCSDERPCPMHEFWKAQRLKIREQLEATTLAQIAQHQRLTGFHTQPPAELMDELPMPAKVYRAKPTGRFLRKFGVKR